MYVIPYMFYACMFLNEWYSALAISDIFFYLLSAEML